MDDDYFIGQSLNKSNFFCVIKGKVKPALISTKFIKLDMVSARQQLNKYKNLVKETNLEQNSPWFRYSLYLTYLYIMKLFGNSFYLPSHTHNAIPINLSELKEIYDLVYQSDYKKGTLDSLYRAIDNLQFQTFVSSYTFIKYKRKVKSISNKLINIKNTINADFNYSLFCINTGALNYTSISFMISKIVMEYLFPNISPYEIDNNYNVFFSAFNIIYSIEKDLSILKKKFFYKIEKLENELNNYKFKLTHLLHFIILIFLSLLIYFKYIFKLKII